MRVLVTADTRNQTELVLGRRRREVAGLRFVALGARGGGMASVKVKTRFLVAYQRKRGRAKPLYCVAALAIVKIWSASELPAVRILVTICARIVLDVVQRVSPRGQVALIAGNRGVFAR